MDSSNYSVHVFQKQSPMGVTDSLMRVASTASVFPKIFWWTTLFFLFVLLCGCPNLDWFWLKMLPFFFQNTQGIFRLYMENTGEPQGIRLCIRRVNLVHASYYREPMPYWPLYSIQYNHTFWTAEADDLHMRLFYCFLNFLIGEHIRVVKALW